MSQCRSSKCLVIVLIPRNNCDECLACHNFTNLVKCSSSFALSVMVTWWWWMISWSKSNKERCQTTSEETKKRSKMQNKKPQKLNSDEWELRLEPQLLIHNLGILCRTIHHIKYVALSFLSSVSESRPATTHKRSKALLQPCVSFIIHKKLLENNKQKWIQLSQHNQSKYNTFNLQSSEALNVTVYKSSFYLNYTSITV